MGSVSGPASCVGCKHCQAGRWIGWACKKGVPGDDDDHSCWEEDKDKEFWNKRQKQLITTEEKDDGTTNAPKHIERI